VSRRLRRGGRRTKATAGRTALWTASLWTASLWTARWRTKTTRWRTKATGRGCCVRLRRAHRRRCDAEHRSLQLWARRAGWRSCRGRRSCRCGHAWCRGGCSGSRCWRARPQARRRIHHQHRALELRGRGTFEAEPALLAGGRRFFVLSPTVRTKHSKYLPQRFDGAPSLLRNPSISQGWRSLSRPP
jgi:hypothetical protein